MIVAIIQARMGSTRLPGKVLAPIGDKPLIQHVVERTQAAQRLDRVILATTAHASDDPLVAWGSDFGVDVFRGSVDDVLDRYYQAAQTVDADVIVRVTGDCPLIDPAVIDATIGLFTSGDYAYANNFMHRTYPDGLDTEVMTRQALATAWRNATLKSEREHVTPYLYKNPDQFPQVGLVQPYAMGDMRWTVDEAADLEFIRAIYNALDNPLFGMHDIATLLTHNPHLSTINAGIGVNEGYQKSLAKDE